MITFEREQGLADRDVITLCLTHERAQLLLAAAALAVASPESGVTSDQICLTLSPASSPEDVDVRIEVSDHHTGVVFSRTIAELEKAQLAA